MTALLRQSLIGAALSLALPLAAQTAPRPVRASDLLKIKAVSDPQLSPDGAWVAYTVTTIDSAKDKSDADLWMTSWDGKADHPSHEHARAREHAALESRRPLSRVPLGAPGEQRRAGMAARPPRRRSAAPHDDQGRRVEHGVVARRPEARARGRPRSRHREEGHHQETADRDHALRVQARRGGLSHAVAQPHPALSTWRARSSTRSRSGMEDDEEPRWSPDGKRIAFIRSPAPEPGVGEGSDVFVLDVASPGTPRNLTNLPGPRPRSAGVEPRRRVDRLPAHRRAQVVRVPARQARHREERRQRGAARAHHGARPPAAGSGVHRRRRERARAHVRRSHREHRAREHRRRQGDGRSPAAGAS